MTPKIWGSHLLTGDHKRSEGITLGSHGDHSGSQLMIGKDSNGKDSDYEAKILILKQIVWSTPLPQEWTFSRLTYQKFECGGQAVEFWFNRAVKLNVLRSNYKDSDHEAKILIMKQRF